MNLRLIKNMRNGESKIKKSDIIKLITNTLNNCTEKEISDGLLEITINREPAESLSADSTYKNFKPGPVSNIKIVLDIVHTHKT